MRLVWLSSAGLVPPAALFSALVKLQPLLSGKTGATEDPDKEPALQVLRLQVVFIFIWRGCAAYRRREVPS